LMNKTDALALLLSDSPEDRLLGVRALEENATRSDLLLLQNALARESVPWIKFALEKLVISLSGDSVKDSPVIAQIASDEFEFLDQVRNLARDEALRETTRTLGHEIDPILGVLEAWASSEVPNFSTSQTKVHLDRLKGLVLGLRTLGDVSGSPTIRQFDLLQVICDVRETEMSKISARVEVAIAKPDPLLVVADKAYIEIALANGLRNAIESTIALEENRREAVIISFGKTRNDYWICVFDDGAGLEATGSGLFEVGTSTKLNHSGLGLPLARRAMRSLDGGKVTLYTREGGGVRFEMRWPTSVGVQDETVSR
jgi:signal transduction histidine kinase